jgi:hypothetical protein
MRRLLKLFLFVWLLLVAGFALTGCIRRNATITSDPPAAKVWVNGVYRGESPVEVPYNWNWYYDIRLEKPGYEPLTARERFCAAPQNMAPFDLLTGIAPVRSEECQWRHYTMKPKPEF